MSHSTTTQPNQPAFPAPTPSGLCCPICGGAVLAAWWVADLLVCQGCSWSGRAAACKRVNDGDNVLYAEGESNA